MFVDLSPLRFVLLGATIILAGCDAAQGATSGPPETFHGRRLAERHCATCHALTESASSPLADAPTLPQLRARYSAAQMANILNRRMIELHPRMPLLEMGPDEFDAFLAYWETVAPAADASGRGRPKNPVERGQAIVIRDCGGCHATGEADKSAFPAAPPFRELGGRYDVEGLAEALAEGISVGHPAMPERAYPAEEVAEIIGYLKSVQPKGSRPEAGSPDQRSRP